MNYKTNRTDNLKTGQEIEFIWRKRLVQGVISSIPQKFIVVKLTHKYIGKQYTWDIGETKCFSKKELETIYPITIAKEFIP